MSVHETSRKFLRFLWKGTSYQCKALPFGLCSAPRIFTKESKTCCRIPEEESHSSPYIPGRLSSSGCTSGESCEKYSVGGESPSVPRFFNKPQQIITNSNTSDNLPGFPNRLNAHDAISPGRKNRQNCRLLSPFARFSRYHIAKPSKLNRFALRDRFCRPQLQYFTSLFLALNISALPSLAANYRLLSRQPTLFTLPSLAANNSLKTGV